MFIVLDNFMSPQGNAEHIQESNICRSGFSTIIHPFNKGSLLHYFLSPNGHQHVTGSHGEVITGYKGTIRPTVGLKEPCLNELTSYQPPPFTSLILTENPFRYYSILCAVIRTTTTAFYWLAHSHYVNQKLLKITGCRAARKWRQSQPRSVCLCSAVGRVEGWDGGVSAAITEAEFDIRGAAKHRSSLFPLSNLWLLSVSN